MSRDAESRWVGFPYRADHRGRTATADLDRHVRDLVEQLLFTSPGERVNRPSLGTNLRHAVFAPNADQLATALEHMVQAALQRWLSDYLVVQAVDIHAEDNRLVVDLRYLVRHNRELRQARFEREL